MLGRGKKMQNDYILEYIFYTAYPCVATLVMIYMLLKMVWFIIKLCFVREE